MRAIAFLPVIIGSGVLMDILKTDVFSTGVKGAETAYLFSGGGLNSLFAAMGLSQDIIGFINNVISRIFDLTWRSGVQILLFLAGLHNIPSYVYEAADIEGANALEQFFKITLPYMLHVTAPYLITQFIGNLNNFNVIFLLTYGGGPSLPLLGYDVTATDTDLLITWLYKLIFRNNDYGVASVISIMMFLMTAVVSLVVYNRSSAVKNEEDFM